MSTGGPTPLRLNIFAATLEDILRTAPRNLSISKLDDRGDPLRRIHPEKVRRLQQSLVIPGRFPTLNPDEMDFVIEEFGLDREEELRLRGAIIATTVEALLYNRGVSAEGALAAGQQIMPAVFAALRDLDHKSGNFGTFRQGSLSSVLPPTSIEEAFDTVLESALVEIDRATLALHMFRGVRLQQERTDRAREARDAFASALLKLHDAWQRIQTNPEWSTYRVIAHTRIEAWEREVKSGLEAAESQLE